MATTPIKAIEAYKAAMSRTNNKEERPLELDRIEYWVIEASQDRNRVECWQNIQRILHQELQKAREIADLYNELLQAVEYKHEGETRHQTALRYIQQVEIPDLTGATAYQSELDQHHT